MADPDESDSFEALLREVARARPAAMPQMPFVRGARLANGRFTVVRRLGSGGMGVVYEAHDAAHDEQIALKTLQQMDASALYMFKNEFRALSHVVHPNLVRQYELFCDHGQWFFTMELVDGCDFTEWVCGASNAWPTPLAQADTRPVAEEAPPRAACPETATGPSRVRTFDVTRLRAALAQLADGVCALHATGKLHCDLKPSNVLVHTDGRVVILDLGITQSRAAEGVGKTVPGEAAPGTPAFIAPELVMGQAATEAVDWYAFGIMLYDALTGRLPFEGSAASVLHQKTQVPPCSPGALVPGLPSDLVQLCDQLIAIDPRARPDGATIQAQLGVARRSPSLLPEPPPAVSATTLVGRERELSLLRRAMSETDGGQPSVVVVEGPSGVGKTALVTGFLAQVQRDGSPVALLGSCHEAESVPYKAFDALVDALSRLLRAMPDHEAQVLLPNQILALARVFPVLQRVEAVQRVRRRAPLPIDPRVLQRTAFGALRELLGRLAATRPVVLVLDDLQWGDIESARLLLELLSPPDPPALLVLATHRQGDSQTGDCMQFLRQQNWRRLGVTVHTFELEPLRREEAVTLAHELGSTTAASAESIAYESGGNPYFVQELVRFAQENDALAGTGSTDSISVRFNAVLSHRIANLPTPARRALEAACVASGPVPQSVVTRAARLDDGQQTLRLLRAANLVRVVGASGSGPIASYHDRIRHTVVTQLSPATLRRWHARLADALAREPDPDPTALCTHLMSAGDADRAIGFALAAGDRASHQLAFDQAAHFYRLAFEHSDECAPASGALLIKLARALVNAERGAEAAAYFQLAARRAAPAEASELKRMAAEELLLAGHVRAGVELLEETLASTGAQLSRPLTELLLPPPDAQSPQPSIAHEALTDTLALREALLARGLEFVPTHGGEDPLPADLRSRTDTCWSAAFGLTLIQHGLNRPFVVRHLLHALDLGDPSRVARGLCLYAMHVEALMGGPVENLLSRAAGIVEAYPDPRTEGWIAMARAYTAAFDMRFGSAITHLELAHETFRARCTGVAREVATCEAVLTFARSLRGMHQDISSTYLPWLRAAERHGNWYLVTSLKLYSVPTLLLQDRHALARRYAEEASAPEALVENQAFRFTALCWLGHCDAYLGIVDGLGGLETWADEFLGSVYAGIMVYRSAFLRTRAVTALVAAEASDDAGAHLDTAARDAEQLDAIDTMQTHAQAAAIRAGVAGLRGEPATLQHWLEQALERSQGPDGDLLLQACICYRLATCRDDSQARTEAERDLRDLGANDISRTVSWQLPGTNLPRGARSRARVSGSPGLPAP